MTKIRKNSGIVTPQIQLTTSAYADWIDGMDWQWWCTFTTNYKLTLPSARRLMERFAKINKSYGLQTTLFWVAERYECKDGWHTHALMSNLNITDREPVAPGVQFDILRHTYQKACGSKVECNDKGKLTYDNYNRLQLKLYDKSKGGAGKYCTKYILKTERTENKMADYDLII